MPGNFSLYFAFAIMGFFLGSIMFALILPRHFKGIDVRKLSDDGNPGTANAVKYGGVPFGPPSLPGGLPKAAFPLLPGRRLFGMGHPLFSPVLVGPLSFSPLAPPPNGEGGGSGVPRSLK